MASALCASASVLLLTGYEPLLLSTLTVLEPLILHICTNIAAFWTYFCKLNPSPLLSLLLGPNRRFFRGFPSSNVFPFASGSQLPPHLCSDEFWPRSIHWLPRSRRLLPPPVPSLIWTIPCTFQGLGVLTSCPNLARSSISQPFPSVGLPAQPQENFRVLEFSPFLSIPPSYFGLTHCLFLASVCLLLLQDTFSALPVIPSRP